MVHINIKVESTARINKIKKTIKLQPMLSTAFIVGLIIAADKIPTISKSMIFVSPIAPDTV